MSREMEGIERIRAGPAQGGKRPEDMSPQEMYAVLWQVLSFRDSGKPLYYRTGNCADECGMVLVAKKIEKTIGVFSMRNAQDALSDQSYQRRFRGSAH
jgi:hypothetical protein